MTRYEITGNEVVDCNLTRYEALQPIPGRPVPPPELVRPLICLAVKYWGLEEDGGLLVPDEREHVGVVIAHRRRIPALKAFFRLAFDLQHPLGPAIPANDRQFRGVYDGVEFVGLLGDDQRMMANNITSCFNYRPIAGRTTLSTHSSGNGFDALPRFHSYQRRVQDPGQPEGRIIITEPQNLLEPVGFEAFSEDHPLVELMQNGQDENGTPYDMVWGGTWTLKEDGVVDRHHFGYQEY